MSEEDSIKTIALIDQGGLADLQAQVDKLCQQVGEVQSDIQFIKAFFVDIQEKKERQRLKKEQERLERERQARARKNREFYEDIVWHIEKKCLWRFMPAPKSKLSPKELQMVSLMTKGLSDKEAAVRMNLKEGSISPRLCAINSSLGVNSRDQVLEY